MKRKSCPQLCVCTRASNPRQPFSWSFNKRKPPKSESRNGEPSALPAIIASGRRISYLLRETDCVMMWTWLLGFSWQCSIRSWLFCFRFYLLFLFRRGGKGLTERGRLLLLSTWKSLVSLFLLAKQAIIWKKDWLFRVEVLLPVRRPKSAYGPWSQWLHNSPTINRGKSKTVTARKQRATDISDFRSETKKRAKVRLGFWSSAFANLVQRPQQLLIKSPETMQSTTVWNTNNNSTRHHHACMRWDAASVLLCWRTGSWCRTLWNLITPKWHAGKSKIGPEKSKKHAVAAVVLIIMGGLLLVTIIRCFPFSQWPGPGKPIDAYTPFRYHLLRCH